MNTIQYAYWLKRQLDRNPGGIPIPSHLQNGQIGEVKEVLLTNKLDPDSDRDAPKYVIVRGVYGKTTCWAGADLNTPCDFKALMLEGQDESALELNELLSCDLEVHGYSMSNLILMSEIVEINKRGGFHFFEKRTMKSFRSRIGRYGYLDETSNVAFFVTSEKSPSFPREWRVRIMDLQSGEMYGLPKKQIAYDAFGPFNSWDKANRAAIKLAKGN